MLDPLNEKHLYALHYVFIPRINEALKEFSIGWNQHSIRTSHHKPPHQLFTACMLLLQHSGLAALFSDDYGQDSDGPIPPSHDASVVEIPQVNLVLNSDNYSTLQRAVNPLQPSGMDLYEQVLQLLATFRF